MSRPPRTASTTLQDLFAEAQHRKLRQKVIASNMDVTRECVANWRRGKTTPDILTVEQLAASLGFRLCLFPVIDEQACPVR